MSASFGTMSDGPNICNMWNICNICTQYWSYYLLKSIAPLDCTALLHIILHTFLVQYDWILLLWIEFIARISYIGKLFRLLHRIAYWSTGDQPLEVCNELRTDVFPPRHCCHSYDSSPRKRLQLSIHHWELLGPSWKYFRGWGCTSLQRAGWSRATVGGLYSMTLGEGRRSLVPFERLEASTFGAYLPK